MVHYINKPELAGFDLAGERQADGTIHLQTNPTDEEPNPVEEWPREATFQGDYHTYTLEYVRKQTDDGVVKLDPDEAVGNTEEGREWGVYV